MVKISEAVGQLYIVFLFRSTYLVWGLTWLVSGLGKPSLGKTRSNLEIFQIGEGGIFLKPSQGMTFHSGRNGMFHSILAGMKQFTPAGMEWLIPFQLEWNETFNSGQN